MQCVLSTQPMTTGAHMPEMMQQNEHLKKENERLQNIIQENNADFDRYTRIYKQYDEEITTLKTSAETMRKKNKSLKEEITQEKKNRLIDRHQYEQRIETLQIELDQEVNFARDLITKLQK